MELVKGKLGERPAGRTTDAEGQQPEGVLVLNSRDVRALAWLISEAGFDAVHEACGRLAGRRRLYPTNLAKALGLRIPESVATVPATDALARIRKLREQFPGLVW